MAKEKIVKKETEEVTKKQRIVNAVFTAIQILLVAVCIAFSIVIIKNPSIVQKDPAKFKTDVMVVETDSMTPTISTNAVVLGKEYKYKTEADLLPMGTVVTYAKKLENGYVMNTHRIVGYLVSGLKDGKTDYQICYYEKGSMETMEDVLTIYPGYELVGYRTRGDKYTLKCSTAFLSDNNTAEKNAFYAGLHTTNVGNTVTSGTIYDSSNNVVYSQDDQKDNGFLNYMGDFGVLATYNGKIEGLGGLIKFLQTPLYFALVIIIPLVLLFAYNVFLMVRILIDEKTKKAKALALEEAKNSIDEEEIKRKAIEEYLAKMAAEKTEKIEE